MDSTTSAMVSIGGSIMYGSDNLPLGPNGEFPRQRISSAGNEIANPNQMEGLYRGSMVARLPVLERDFHSSISRVKNRTRQGKPFTNGQKEVRELNRFFPRFGQRLSFGLSGGGRSAKYLFERGYKPKF